MFFGLEIVVCQIIVLYVGNSDGYSRGRYKDTDRIPGPVSDIVDLRPEPCRFQSFETYLKNRTPYSDYYAPEVCDKYYCLNGGKCRCTSSYGRIIQTCSCPYLYTGRRCQIGPCDRADCGDNGYCVHSISAEGGFACVCNEGYGFNGFTCVQQCPPGTAEYVGYGSPPLQRRICYYAIYSKQNQHDSATICQNTYNGGDLAIIPNEAANNFISGPHFAFNDGNRDGFWIGVNDIMTEDTYVDTEGNEISFTNWRNDQPNDPNSSQNCVVVFPKDNYEWQDKSCTETNHRQALCSINIDLPTAPTEWK